MTKTEFIAFFKARDIYPIIHAYLLEDVEVKELMIEDFNIFVIMFNLWMATIEDPIKREMAFQTFAIEAITHFSQKFEMVLKINRKTDEIVEIY